MKHTNKNRATFLLIFYAPPLVMGQEINPWTLFKVYSISVAKSTEIKRRGDEEISEMRNSECGIIEEKRGRQKDTMTRGHGDCKIRT